MGRVLFIIGIVLIVLGIAALVLSGLSAFFIYIPLFLIGGLLIFLGRKKE